MVKQPPEAFHHYLSDWHPDGAGARTLLGIYSSALNTSVARRCIELLSEPHDEALRDELQNRLAELRASQWTTPGVSYAQHVTLKSADPVPAARAAARDLLTIGATVPPIQFAPEGPVPAWREYSLRVFEADQERDERAVRLGPMTVDDHARDQARRALELLRVAWPEMADSTDTFVREVWWFGSEGKASGSASLAQAFGVVFIGSTSPPSLLMEHIVHEATHHEFTARLAVDKQLTNGDALAPSPFRKNPRPLTRVLHAAVVAARLVEVLRRCQQYLDADERAQVQKSLDRLTLDLESGMRSLTEHAHWTPVGERMFDRMREFQTRTLVA